MLTIYIKPLPDSDVQPGLVLFQFHKSSRHKQYPEQKDTCGCWSSQATQGQVLRLIEEEAAHDRTTTDQPRREHLISGTTESPKREQISMWSVEAWQSHSKQCKMHGITGYPVGFQKVSHSKHCRMHGIKGNKL